jgi:hypothetical protein
MPEAEKIERLLASPTAQWLFRRMTAKKPGGRCWLEEFFERYAGGSLRWYHLRFALPYLLTEYVRRKAGAKRETLAGRVFGNPATRRGLVATVRSVGHLGLGQPQRFVAPLMVVWNFTQACNLQCKHCYQEAGKRHDDELSIDEQKRILLLLAHHPSQEALDAIRRYSRLKLSPEMRAWTDLAQSECEQFIEEKRTDRPVDSITFGISKISRNDPCPCGSGKKFKNCCGR